MISLIWAESKNGVIGKDGDIPWYLPNDLKYFQSLTQNNIVIMGYNTFLTLPRLKPQAEYLRYLGGILK